MDDLTCHVCSALVTPLGQTDGVFCRLADCPGDRLSRVDVMNVCRESAFCLSFTGTASPVKADATVVEGRATTPKKGKRRPLPAASRPGLFD